MKSSYATAGRDGADTALAPAARWALASLALSMLMPSLDTSIANVGLPALAQAFHAPFAHVQWIVLAYLLAITSLIVGAGRLGDLYGRRGLLLAGIAVFTLASLVCGMARSLEVLVAARAIQGFGAAAMLAMTLALVGEAVPKTRTGRAMGLLGTMSAIGTTLGPSLGGLLIAGFGWHAIFLVNVPIGLANALLALRFLPADTVSSRGAGRPRFDTIGTPLLAMALLAYALAMTVGQPHFGVRNAGWLLSAAAIGTVFAWTQTRVRFPLLNLPMFRDASLSVGLIMNLAVATVIASTFAVGPFYLTRGLGLATAQAGLVLSAGPLVSALSGVPAGRMVDRFGARRLSIAGLTGMALGLIALTLLPQRLGVAGYVASIALMTVHYALFQAANNTVVMTGVSPERRGVISGMLSLSRNLGLITGTAALGAVFAAGAGTADLGTVQPAAVAHGMRLAYSAAAVIIAAALGVGLINAWRASDRV
jgi:EmrB/QacA subfamily drug resistance transporter